MHAGMERSVHSALRQCVQRTNSHAKANPFFFNSLSSYYYFNDDPWAAHLRSLYLKPRCVANIHIPGKLARHLSDSDIFCTSWRNIGCHKWHIWNVDSANQESVKELKKIPFIKIWRSNLMAQEFFLNLMHFLKKYFK